MFEAFMVFYLLECMVLLAWYMLFGRERSVPKSKKIYDPWNFWEGIK
jgi:hypothetical protein